MAIEDRLSVGMRLCDYVERLVASGAKFIKIDQDRGWQWTAISTSHPKTSICHRLDSALIELLVALERDHAHGMLQDMVQVPDYMGHHTEVEGGEYWHMWKSSEGSLVGLSIDQFPEGSVTLRVT